MMRFTACALNAETGSTTLAFFMLLVVMRWVRAAGLVERAMSVVVDQSQNAMSVARRAWQENPVLV